MRRRRSAETNARFRASACRSALSGLAAYSLVLSGLVLSGLVLSGLLDPSIAIGDDGLRPTGHVGARKSRAAAADALWETGPDREVKVRFVHSVWNMSSERLYGVSIGVAVPRNDAHQTVHSVVFDPPPSSFSDDGWDQKTALFRLDELGPNDKFEIRATIEVSLRDLEWRVVERDVGGFQDIPDRVLTRYLGDGRKYRLQSEDLERAARSLRIDRGGIIEQVRRIHDYVTDRLEYERDHRWDPADTVLRRGTGSCSEYSYLMIALCRLSGIPARYAGGSWLGEGEPTTPHVDRIFHRWVEVYLPRVGWYPVDPTENDRRATDGDYYPCFGRVPWSYFTMVRGGDQFDSELLGWDYRSGTRWTRPSRLPTGQVFVDRYAVWVEEKARGESLATGSSDLSRPRRAD